MLNCWRVNESWTVDITEFVIQKLSAVFVTKKLLELGGDEYDNLNFMNFKIDSFKIRKNSWILGTFIIHKIRTFNLCCESTAIGPHYQHSVTYVTRVGLPACGLLQ